MYAVTFDIDTNCLGEQYHNESSTNAYGDIRKFMEANNFNWQQGSVYFGNETINAVNCVMVIQKLAKAYPWFTACVKDVRMLRIEENNDLLPALGI
ncbi:MAG: virulence factor [Campylobacterota bacterium]|nr:virulence factor [Campylobacterota bacterium]